MTVLIFTLGLLWSSNLVAGNFSYDGELGPDHWGEQYPTCLGKSQAPINIVVENAAAATYPPLEFSNIENPHKSSIMNNGHTVMIRNLDSDTPAVSGGPLNDTYYFLQMHFHWGQYDGIGAETRINNRTFSLEAHAVLWKKGYGTSDEAMNHEDGLTVLAYLYEVTDKPNPIFEPLVSQLPEVTGVGTNTTFNNKNLLNRLIAQDLSSAQYYYTYKGSLTTPPCSEIVQFINFEKIQSISHDQLQAFRSLRSIDGGNITHNFRPLQPLNGRTVYRNAAEEDTAPEPAKEPVNPGTIAPSYAGTSEAAVTKTVTKKPEVATNKPNMDVTPSLKPRDDSYYDHSGQSTWTMSPLAAMAGIVALLAYH
ncbi:carbonic anhydrase 1 [Xylocopa sonorina]|uniref:carbonic anhydrase 1 n=1 Tax=Xylocopa sonorina TaxID=1818115 RepID=UPI00403AE047